MEALSKTLETKTKFDAKTMKKTLYNTFSNKASSVLLAVGVLLAASAVAFDVSKDKPDHPAVNVPMDETAVSRDTLPHGSYAPVVKKVTPAVVKIVTTTRVNENAQQQMPG